MIALTVPYQNMVTTAKSDKRIFYPDNFTINYLILQPWVTAWRIKKSIPGVIPPPPKYFCS